MKRFYSVHTAVLNANPPSAHYAAMVCPGDPTWSLVVVHQWESYDAQDAWEALPSVAEHYLESLGQLASPAVVAALGPLGVTSTMTMRQVFTVVRRSWSAWRH